MKEPAPTLSIVVAVVGGVACLKRCLSALVGQIDATAAEVIVPYDRFCSDVAALGAIFPGVSFVAVTDLGLAADSRLAAHAHRLYDRRRAVGLGAARGEIVAMTEDDAVPARDWCAQILAAHAQPYAAIGGAIENGEDRPLNWALYYCDFGRYGRPFAPGPAAYVSDVNVSYKRRALEATRALWERAYHETTVHWALRAGGERLFLDPRPVVFQHRPPCSLAAAYRERIEWGRVFAETRAAASPARRRAVYAAGSVVLPVLLAARAARHMRRQGHGATLMARVIPLACCLLTGWAAGEFLGYLRPAPEELPAKRA